MPDSINYRQGDGHGQAEHMASSTITDETMSVRDGLFQLFSTRRGFSAKKDDMRRWLYCTCTIM
jgi:hypothetical protein